MSELALGGELSFEFLAAARGDEEVALDAVEALLGSGW